MCEDGVQVKVGAGLKFLNTLVKYLGLGGLTWFGPSLSRRASASFCVRPTRIFVSSVLSRSGKDMV